MVGLPSSVNATHTDLLPDLPQFEDSAPLS